MGILVRLLLFGWVFAIVLLAAWLGLLGPSPDPGTASPGPLPATERDEVTSSTEDGCRTHRLDDVTFFDRTSVLRPESEAAIVDFAVDLRAVACVADVTGTYCSTPDASVMLHGHAGAGGATIAEQYRLSFERALAVATVLMANDITVGSVIGTGPEALGPAGFGVEADPVAQTVTVADGPVELGLRCPAVQRP